MLNAQVEKEAEMSERRTAFYALGKQRGNLSPAAANEAIIRENSMTSEEFMAEKEKNILEYVENFCKIDRKSLWEMFELIRNGTAPLSMK